MTQFSRLEQEQLRRLVSLAPLSGRGSPVGVVPAPINVTYIDTETGDYYVSLSNRDWVRLATGDQLDDAIKSIPDDSEKSNPVEVDIPASWEPHPDGAWTDVVVPIGALDVRPSASQPTSAVFGGDFPSLASRRFSHGDYAYIDGVQLPHGYIKGSNLHPHFHFYPTVDIADGETVLFSLTLAHSQPFETLRPEEKYTMTFINNEDTRRRCRPATVNTDNSIRAFTHLIAGGVTVDGTNMDASTVLMGQVSYLATSTHASNVFAASYDNHAKFNRIGTRLEYSD